MKNFILKISNNELEFQLSRLGRYYIYYINHFNHYLRHISIDPPTCKRDNAKDLANRNLKEPNSCIGWDGLAGWVDGVSEKNRSV